MSKPDERTSFYQMDDNFVRLRMKMENTSKGGSGASKKGDEKLLFVVDRSSSMHGQWDKVLKAVDYMNQTRDQAPDFILYCHTACEASIFEVLQSRPNGSTSFNAAFQSIISYISKQPANAHINVIFMTDGHNNGNDLELGFSMLAAFLKNCRRTSCIHTIGFSEGHDRKMLDRIRVLGSSEGDYRYADSKDLEEKFAELFDFLSTSKKVTVSIGSNEPLIVDAQKTETGQLLDLFLKKSDIDPKGELFTEKDVTITIDSIPCTLSFKEREFFFRLRRIEEAEILSQKDLDKAQKNMKGLIISKVEKQRRREALELKMIVQDKLDKFHALFAEIARGLVSGDNVTAQLNSLRHESKFGKARRARAMDQRIAKNIDSFLDIEDKLTALPPPDIKAFENLDLCCTLSSSTIADIMRDSTNDLMVFPLRIIRPEQAIDAPTQIIVEKFMVGHYSFEAFKDSVQYAIKTVGSQKALGGFTTGTNDEAVGLFKGADGELTNACLPLYIHDDHWKRVEIQIEPILGYFFTMDPLGYKGDQILALFMILGNMLCSRANGTFSSEAADWIISDFTKTCTALLPKIVKYIEEGRLGGIVRHDLAQEFVASPVNRSKEILSDLLVLVGWNHCKNVRDNNVEQYDLAFVEETWRRCFSRMFKGQPTQQLHEWIEALLFGAEKEATTQGSEVESENLSGHELKTESKLFAEWAKGKLGLLSKNKAAEVLRKYKDGPKSAKKEEEYAPRSILMYEENSEQIDRLVSSILERIEGQTKFISNLYDGAVTGSTISGKTKWLMLIQSLQYCSNSKMNQALANGNYKNTYEYCCDSSDKSLDEYLQPLFDKFELNRKQDWAALLLKKQSFMEAKKCVMSPDLYSFAGRMMKSCPTRGGEVFANVVALLSAGNVDGKNVPLLYEKIKVVMLGKISFVEGGDTYDILGGGFSWSQCPQNIAVQLRDALNEEKWISIENKMYGVTGWVYRASDIPNRHGHCNSNPNGALTSKFQGFNLPASSAEKM